MALEKKQHPYEFLARWGEDGTLQGAHVGFITRIYDDGVLISHKLADVIPVDIGQGAGYPLEDILETLHVDALAAHAELQRKYDEIKDAHAELQQENEKLKQALEQPRTA